MNKKTALKLVSTTWETLNIIYYASIPTTAIMVLLTISLVLSPLMKTPEQIFALKVGTTLMAFQVMFYMVRVGYKIGEGTLTKKAMP